MATPLDEYWRKRNFDATAEPAGIKPKSRRGKRSEAQARAFCIQKHAARRLHYDFRLELEGTLKSWAVPKGPSLDPKARRLAVHVEDHPIEYATFEGNIAEGLYGAGEVIVWDQGTWVPEGDPVDGYRKGKLKFELQGQKLRGRWNLVRTRMDGGKEQWFLIKSNDEQARPENEFSITEALPDSVLSDRTLAPEKPATARRKSRSESKQKPMGTLKTPAPKRARNNSTPALEGARTAPLPEKLKPQLATLVDAAPRGNWRYEIKFDGYRILARVDNAEVRLITRSGLDWTAKMPQQAQALAELGLESAWLDGEVAVASADGLPHFQSLQNAFNTGQSGHIVFYLFDLPYLNGQDLREVPLEQRRSALDALLKDNDNPLLRFSADFAESGEAMLNSACELRMEGLIGKREGSFYSGRRSRDWIKLKCAHRQEFVIVGYTDPRNSRAHLGALLLGLHDTAGGALRYAGKVGTGFDAQTLQAVHRQLVPLTVKKPIVVNPPTGAEARGVHWVRPTLLAEVAYAQITRDGIVRHAVFHGLRDDKPAAAITQERPKPASSVVHRKARPISANSTNDSSADNSVGSSASPSPETALAGLTHPERIIDPSTATTKLQLAEYYLKVWPRIEPHLHERPVALMRAPDGIGGELFFQKHAERLKIPEITRLDKSHAGQPVMILDKVEALLGAVQMNSIEFHTWNASRADFDHPDRFILDLDPDPALPWARMIEAAQLTLTVLDELGLSAYLKTSGGKGLHIVVPLIPERDWDSVKTFSRAIVKHMARLVPDRFTAVSGPKNRVGKIFIDYLRNSHGATTICAFAARARPGLAVSVPIARDELETLKGADVWTIHNLQERLSALKQDPWDSYEQNRQRLTDEMHERLNLAP